MKNASPLPELISQVFQPTPRGVVGLVDDLLGICSNQGLQFEWRDGRCRVRRIGVESAEPLDISMPKSVFRALLARLATLCNEQNPDSVSPYSGEGELTVDTNPPVVLHLVFVNTPDEQRGELAPIQQSKAKSVTARDRAIQ